jgi:hypothetical protein
MIALPFRKPAFMNTFIKHELDDILDSKQNQNGTRIKTKKAD